MNAKPEPIAVDTEPEPEEPEIAEIAVVAKPPQQPPMPPMAPPMMTPSLTSMASPMMTSLTSMASPMMPSMASMASPMASMMSLAPPMASLAPPSVPPSPAASMMASLAPPPLGSMPPPPPSMTSLPPPSSLPTLPPSNALGPGPANQCRLCGYICGGKGALLLHVKQCSASQLKMIFDRNACQLCDNAFLSKELLLVHMEKCAATQLDELERQRMLYGYNQVNDYYMGDEIKVEELVDVPVISIEDDDEPRAKRPPPSRPQQQQQSDKPGKHMCPNCKKGPWAFDYQLRRHMQNDCGKEKRTFVRPPPQPYQQPQQQQQQMETHACKLCNDKFRNEHLLLFHLCFWHFSSYLAKLVPDEAAPFRCPVSNCQKTEDIKYQMVLHYGTEHKKVMELYAKDGPWSREDKAAPHADLLVGISAEQKQNMMTNASPQQQQQFPARQSGQGAEAPKRLFCPKCRKGPWAFNQQLSRHMNECRERQVDQSIVASNEEQKQQARTADQNGGGGGGSGGGSGSGVYTGSISATSTHRQSCKLCDEAFNDGRQLLYHLCFWHFSGYIAQLIPDDQSPYRCPQDQCPTTESVKYQLVQHLGIDHRKAVELYDQEGPWTMEGRAPPNPSLLSGMAQAVKATGKWPNTGCSSSAGATAEEANKAAFLKAIVGNSASIKSSTTGATTAAPATPDRASVRPNDEATDGGGGGAAYPWVTKNAAGGRKSAKAADDEDEEEEIEEGEMEEGEMDDTTS